jgi:glycosyltransferase involved in cell wall biosynthesis
VQSKRAFNRLLFVISGMSSGGAERVASIMLRHWVDTDLEVGLLTFSPVESDHYTLMPELERLHLNLTWDSSNTVHGVLSNIRRLRMIRKEITGFSPDIVVSFIDQTNILVLLALLGTRMPVIVSERTNPTMYNISRKWQLLRRLVYRFADQVVVQTKSVADWALTHTRADRISIIQNPLDRLPQPSPWSARKNQIVAIGRLGHEKGFDILLRAFAGSDAFRAGWRLVLVGEGDERRSIERQINDLDIGDQIEMTGTVDDPAVILNSSKVFVLSSRFEGFPNALSEAMAMGCACVSTDCKSGPADIIDDGINGLLVRVDDVDAMRKGIDQLILSPATAQEYGMRAQAIRSSLSAGRIMDQWDDLLKSVIALRGNRT